MTLKEFLFLQFTSFLAVGIFILTVVYGGVKPTLEMAGLQFFLAAACYGLAKI